MDSSVLLHPRYSPPVLDFLKSLLSPLPVLSADNFYEWNLSTGSGTYRIQSVSATEGDLSFVTEFSNMYQNLPEEGLLVQKITVTEVVIEKIPAAGEESPVLDFLKSLLSPLPVLSAEAHSFHQ